MEMYRFNVEKEERKALVRAISGITGTEAKYLGAPGFAFKVGFYTIGRSGTVTVEGSYDRDAHAGLLARLVEDGFVYETGQDGGSEGGCEGTDETFGDSEDDAQSEDHSEVCGEDMQDTDHSNVCGEDMQGVELFVGTYEECPCPDESSLQGMSLGFGFTGTSAHAPNEWVPDTGSEPPMDAQADIAERHVGLVIEMPLQGLSAAAIANINNLTASKAWILRKMTGSESLPIERLEDRLRFPWFKADPSDTEVEAFTMLVSRICETAKEKMRVNASEKPPQPGDNEKYKARCFLLSLGFKGDEYSSARKVLLASFPGSGSFLQGNSKKTPLLS